MDISYYQTRDGEQKKKRNRKLWNICKMILAIILLILVIYGASHYMMLEMM